MRQLLRVVLAGGALALTTGCAAKGTIRQVAETPMLEATRGSAEDSLEVFIGKLRERSALAGPTTERAQTLESRDPALSGALLRSTLRPSAAAHRLVAREYARLGVLDEAHEHLSMAVAMDPRDAAAWDGLARIWRDWGFPHLALPDAYRAVYFAPESPVTHNTLGTVLQALGRRADARAAYAKALEFDVNAAYALTNLCYGWVLDGRVARAAEACRRALALQPDLEAARNNLALAYAVAGDVEGAIEIFGVSDHAGRPEYNAGVIHLARRQYKEALRAFEAAQAARPRFRAAEVMARQARRQMQADEESREPQR